VGKIVSVDESRGFI